MTRAPMKFTLPRGKYNEKPIVGVKLSLRFRIDWFNWLPKMPKYTSSLHWLWFTIRVEVEYGWSDRTP